MFKGRAIIEMFDSKTGKKVYEQKHDNIITNGYKNYINPGFVPGIGFTNGYQFNLESITPFVEKMFGGLMMFSESRDANPDNFMITKEDYTNFVGHAGNTYSGISTYRGSYNTNESGKISDTEYKLVFDFPSNAGNGKIKNLSLCPRYLGDAGLIKDPNDTTATNLIVNYGDSFSVGSPIYDNSQGVQYFHRHRNDSYGNYIYSKDSKTNVYCKLDSKKLYFTEITKKDYIGLTEYVNSGYASSVNLEDTNLYKISEPIELDLSTESSVQSPRYFQYYLEHICFVNYKISGENITFKVFYISAKDYTLTESREYTLSITGFNYTKIYPRFIGNKIYFTTTNKILYIYDIKTESFKTIEIPYQGNIYFEAVKWYDTVMLTRRDYKATTNHIYILDSKDNLCLNMILLRSGNEDYPIFGKVNTNNETLLYPLATATSLYYHSQTSLVEYENQIVMPFVCTINNVEEFTKNSSNTLKITYILKEY